MPYFKNNRLGNVSLNEKRLPRLAILASHIVQYHAPLYREITATRKVDLTVLYCSHYGLEPLYDPTMGVKIQWDVPLLEGYQYKFMINLSKSAYTPLLGRVNPGIIVRLLREQYDVVLIQDYFYLTSWLTLYTTKIAKKKIIFRGEGTLKANQQLGGNHLKDALIRTFIKAADLVLYSCSGNKVWLEYLGANPNKMALAPCSVDNDFFRAQHNFILSRGESSKKQLGLEEDVLYIISAARMDSRKRLLDIVKAVAMLQEMGFQVGLLLVGDGPHRRQIEQRAQELGLKNVHLPGFVNMSRISAYYAAADIFVLTSNYDPSPKSLSEALNFSLPVVCTDTIGTAGDLVRDGQNGFLYPVGNLEVLVDRLSKILSDRRLRQAMGRKSLEISNQWSIKAAAKSVVDAVIRLTGRSI